MKQQVTDTKVLSVLSGWLLLTVGVPYVYAALRTPDGAVEAICARGFTPFTGAALVMFILWIGVLFSRRWLPEWLRAIVHTHGVRLLAAQVLIYLPFVIGWLTHSSVCQRGKAFFWESVLIETFILAMLAVSYNLMFGFSGVVSFGHAAFFGLGSYGVGLLMKHLGWGLFPAALLTLAVSAGLGLLVSAISLRTKGLYFAIFTLALAEILHLLASNRILVDITGAEDGFTFAVPDWINAVQHRLFFYYLALSSLIGIFILVYRVVLSPTGRVLLALRENESRAQMLGYNTFAFKTFAITLAGVTATYAGVLRGLLNKGASPNVLGLNFTMDPLLMTIIGGTGTFEGPVVGAFLLRLAEQLLRDTIIHLGPWQVNIGERWSLILGVLFIVTVLLFPQGLVGMRWRRQSKSA